MLFGLFVVLAFSLVDRNILSILLVDIKAEFQASDTAMGFLTGLAFAVTNAVAGIPLATCGPTIRKDDPLWKHGLVGARRQGMANRLFLATARR